MAEALCRPCEARGRRVPAHHLVPVSPGARQVIPKCGDCWRQNVPVELTALERAIAAERPAPPAAPPAPDPPPAPIFRPAEPIPASLRPNSHPRTRKKGIPMRTDIDWNAVQADRNAGMKLREIEEKYGVSRPTICTRTSPRPGSIYAKGAKRAPKASPKGARPIAAAAAPHGKLAKLAFVNLSEVPMRRRFGAVNEFWVELARKLLDCPKGQAVAIDPLPLAAIETKNPQGAVRGGLIRALRGIGIDTAGFRFFVAVRDTTGWAWPRADAGQSRRAGAENPSKGKAR